MQHLLDMRPARPGYRLHRLEIFNWGTFDSTDGCVYRFEPQGRTSLLVGHNGSGKSTLVDALLTLLVEPRTRNYNVAAGARKSERNEKSYIRGAYARTSDEAQSPVVKYLRPKGTNLTALAAVFRDEQLGRAFTLCQVLYLTAEDSDKIYAISDSIRDLKTDLAGIRSADGIRSQLQRTGYQTTKTFTEYHGWITHRTKMRAKATDMFNQTVAVKDIQSLNDFIRKHMLETHDWREKVQRLLTHFNDLSVAHQELVRARTAEELLTPVETRGCTYRELLREVEAGERKLEAANLFFREKTVQLFEPEIERHQLDFDTTIAHIDRLGGVLAGLSQKIRQLENDLEKAGGDRLRAIPGLIEIESGKLALKKQASDRYHDALKRCGMRDLVSTASDFSEMRTRLQELAKSNADELISATTKHEELIGKRGDVRNQLRGEREELEILSQRQTNLPPKLAILRRSLCEDLQLSEDALPFAAELMSIDPSERRWEASAEMVLRSFALSLLVPDRYHRRVRTYIEHNKLTDNRGEGQRLDYICVADGAEPQGDRIHPQSLVRKLRFRDRHPLTPWVRGEVQRRFDFRCCDSVDDFNDTARLAMTENRHIKVGTDRHQKDDRPRTTDPRFFVLGWDNREKKKLIAERIRSLETDVGKLNETVNAWTAQLEELRCIRDAVTLALQMTDFDQIDLKRHENEIKALEAEKKRLEQSNDTVRSIKKSLTQAQEEEQEVHVLRDAAQEKKALLKKEIEEVRGLVERSRASIAEARRLGTYSRCAGSFDLITGSLGDPALAVADLFSREQQWLAKTRQELDALRAPLQSQAEKLLESMNKFLREFKEERTDLTASVQSLDSFLGFLEQVRTEDLPRYEKKFKDRLNDKVSQEVALFHGALRQECKQIEGKIDQLNQALGQLEYQQGTFMRLEPRQVQDSEIDEFRRSLRECLDESLENTSEANEARFLRIQKLVERLADRERTRWRDKVIDVRNWYNFAAREIEKETEQTRSYHEGSSGQSGGEKAKLAFTILVAAIAYQYDLNPEGTTPGRFHFVVVDEMFSKVDDQNAHYALRLFDKFGLQLLIVAPLDAKARVTEPFVDSYLHVVKDEATSRSQLYAMTAREYEEIVKSFAGNGKSNKSSRVSVP